MKREILGFSLATLIILAVGVLAGRNIYPKECTRKHQNFIEDGRVIIIPVGDVDGRKKFDVIISDENVKEAMYAEEIAKSLITGIWQYNEMLTIQEER
jgi:hypothetical protein